MRKRIFGVCLLLAALFGLSQWMQPLRLHIIANSNSPIDQQVKLQVRDALLESGLLEVAGCADAAQAAEQVAAEAPALQAAAQQVLSQNGMDYTASVYVSQYEFTDRRIGGLTYPAGSYDTVRVVLGEGAGENWWCVMFPPLYGMELPPSGTLPGEEDPPQVTSLLLTWLQALLGI